MTGFFELTPEQQVRRFELAGHDALRQWGFSDASLELIKHRENAVFKVEKDNFRAALRIHRHGYHTNDELRSELQWMQALSESGVLVPNVIPTQSGDLFIDYSGDALPGKLQIDLFEWIEGKQLGSVEAGISDAAEVDAVYGSIGELAAKVHNQATSWQLPEGFVRHAWDAEGLAGENPFWGQFWKLAAASNPETELLERGRDRVFQDLSALAKSPDKYSMIHADFAPENLMVDGNEVRLIDFDDAGFGWHLFELATSLYFIQEEPYFQQAKDALIAGYRRHRQLTDTELEMLPLFFLARGFTYIGWVHTRHETETARELTPMLLKTACELAEDYLNH
jgi:Ser/Thr protein kinase RdoA (MazF antagonist)